METIGKGGVRSISPLELDPREFRAVGSRAIRHDAVDKACGTTAFSTDYSLPGMLYAQALHSEYAHAKILSIDTSRAERIPGVVAVLTSKDVPENSYTSELPAAKAESDAAVKVTQYVLAEGKVRFQGEKVALVAAETLDAAQAAVRAIQIEYEPLPGVFDPVDALHPDAPHVHEGGNLFSRWSIRKGDVQQGFNDADVVVEGTYRTQFIDHAYLEMEGGVAWFDEQGVLTIRCGTQVLEHNVDVARALCLPQNRVRLIGTYMGGGFGGKEDVTVEIDLGLLAWKTKRPVSYVYSREESICSHGKRHPYVLRYSAGVKRTGEITALDAELISDGGAYAYLSHWVLLYSTVTATGPYRIPNVKVESHAVYTNNTFSSAMRCFGSLQTNFAYERHMEEMARAIGMDSVEFRRRNYVKQGDALGTTEPVGSKVMLSEAADAALAKLGPRKEPPRGKRIGRGIAASITPYGRMAWTHDSSSAWVGFASDGTLIVRSGVPDLGGGQASSLCTIAGEVLGVPVEEIAVFIGDTHLTPAAGTTTATRQLTMSGNATYQAAAQVRDAILKVAADLLEASPESLNLAENCAFVRESPGRSVSIQEIVKESRLSGIDLNHLSTYYAPAAETIDPKTGRGKAFNDYTYGVIASEVIVDEDTGSVNVRRLVSSFDVGKCVNSGGVEGQLEGGAIMGLGQALMEDVAFSNGVTLTDSLHSYLIPTSMDSPDVEKIVFESRSGQGPFGAKGIGEPALTPAVAAISNAVSDAIGAPVYELPLTPEVVLDALRRGAS